MNFLVLPYNAVLNVRVLDDAVVADGHVWAYGAVLDDYVLADVALLIIPERRSRQSGEVRATSPA